MTSEDPSLPSALDGVRVVNAGQIIAGPFTATLLAEFGADVIKVESPEHQAVRTVQFAQDHRGQRGVTINLRHPDGKALFQKLCAEAAILVENFRPGTLERRDVAAPAPDRLGQGRRTVLPRPRRRCRGVQGARPRQRGRPGR